MADTLYEEILKTAPTSKSTLKIGGGRIEGEVWPGYNSKYREQYRQVFDRWARMNGLVRKVLRGEATFAQAVTHVLSGAADTREVEACFGEVSSTSSPPDNALWYGLAGLGLGGVGGFAFGRMQTYSDPDLRGEYPLISRRSYLVGMTVACALVFGLGGAAFGYFGSRAGQGNYVEMADYLDKLAVELYR